MDIQTIVLSVVIVLCLVMIIKQKIQIRKLKNTLELKKYTMGKIDKMNGHDFERFVAMIFEKLGYDAEVTKGSNDQGIDVLAIKRGRKYGIQAKRYSKKVTNTAVQEVVAGLKFYGCKKGIVVTNNYFTKSAKELAAANDVELWDRDELERKIKDLKI